MLAVSYTHQQQNGANQMIKITNKQKQVAKYDNVLLPNICVKVCGGGHTIKQTADAMMLQTQIQLHGKAEKNGYTIELQDA